MKFTVHKHPSYPGYVIENPRGDYMVRRLNLANRVALFSNCEEAWIFPSKQWAQIRAVDLNRYGAAGVYDARKAPAEVRHRWNIHHTKGHP